ADSVLVVRVADRRELPLLGELGQTELDGLQLLHRLLIAVVDDVDAGERVAEAHHPAVERALDRRLAELPRLEVVDPRMLLGDADPLLLRGPQLLTQDARDARAPIDEAPVVEELPEGCRGRDQLVTGLVVGAEVLQVLRVDVDLSATAHDSSMSKVNHDPAAAGGQPDRSGPVKLQTQDEAPLGS